MSRSHGLFLNRSFSGPDGWPFPGRSRAGGSAVDNLVIAPRPPRRYPETMARFLVLIVLSSVTTHLFPDGLRVHVRGALSVGVPPDHIMQTFELLAAHGVRSVVDGYGLAELTQPHHSPPVSDSQS